jgi:hypothetical protein
MTALRRFVLCAGAVAILLAARPHAQPPAGDVGRYLQSVAGFAPADLTSMAAGQVIARATTRADDREVAVVAAVRIRASRDRVLAYFNQLVMYEDGQVTIQIGAFSRPPQLADVQRLTLPDADLQALRTCTPGDCDVKIGGTAMTAFRDAIDWSAPDATARANALARQKLVAYVADYAARGNAALIRYNDRSQPVSLAAQWHGLLQNSPSLLSYAPALARHLDEFPRAPLAGGTDVLYWAKENYAGRLVVHADHMVTWRGEERANRAKGPQR